MDKKQMMMLAFAIVAIVLAVFIVFSTYRSTQPQFETVGPNDIEREIQRIQNDPNMPEQAKRTAIEVLRSRYGTPNQGGAGQ